MEPSAAPALWYTILKSYGMLFVVIGILAGFLYLLKRFTGMNYHGGGQNPIKILGSHYIAPKSKLIVVDIQGEKMLLGVTPSAINMITKIPDHAEFSDTGVTEQKDSMFRNLLKGTMKRETSGDGDHD